jgi:hypothetical protein
MSFGNEPSAFMKMMNNDMRTIFVQQHYPNAVASSSFSSTYQTTYQSAYYTALCNASQGYGGGYGGNGGNGGNRSNTGTYNNASWSSDYLI